MPASVAVAVAATGVGPGVLPMMRCPLRRAQVCRAALGAAQQYPAGARHRGETQGRAGRARQ
ncbi:hypothetical protein ACIRL0_11280 [Streptomyces sp. NPDC102365]|uniref:hypothetical protein n=1 Tax=Streptomyces sp. NPDC102365 TaxID=3366162 RepID=UPI0038107B94